MVRVRKEQDMSHQVESQTLTEQPTAAVRACVPTTDVGHWLFDVLEEVDTYLARNGISPAGPPFARFAFHDGKADVEAGFPVSTPVPEHGRVTTSSMPGGPVAVTVHYGRYEDLGGGTTRSPNG
jgi:effector-binding domain-containing protein